MYGKIFEQMYTGSMMGAGALMFAVWPYVISHQKPNRDRTVFTVELNTALMALLIGEKEEAIADTIRKCCEPDPKSRSSALEGKKLVKVGQFMYEVVNGAQYDKIKRQEELREGNRRRQAKHYQKKKENGGNVSEVDEPAGVTAEEIYALFPLKVGKPAAIKAIKKAIERGNDPEYLKERVELFSKSRNGNVEYCPHPGTWFNQDRFNDNPQTWVKNGVQSPKKPVLNQI